MIFDKENLFSNAQAITASAASTNTIDLGATGTPVGASAALKRDIGPGKPIPLRIQVVQAFNNLTSLTVAVQKSADNSTFTDVVSETIALADLKAGATTKGLRFIPLTADARYVRLNYTVTGTAPTAGAITAGIVAAHQENS